MENKEREEEQKSRELYEEIIKNMEKPCVTVQVDVDRDLYEKFKYSIDGWKIGKRKMRVKDFFIMMIEELVILHEKEHGEIKEEQLQEYRKRFKKYR